MIDMEKIKEELIIEAKNKHGKIYPTPGKDSLFDCFTMPLPGKLCLWFMLDDDSKSSGIVFRKL